MGQWEEYTEEKGAQLVGQAGGYTGAGNSPYS